MATSAEANKIATADYRPAEHTPDDSNSQTGNRYPPKQSFMPGPNNTFQHGGQTARGWKLVDAMQSAS